MFEKTNLLSNTRKTYKLDTAILGLISISFIGFLYWNIMKSNEEYNPPKTSKIQVESRSILNPTTNPDNFFRQNIPDEQRVGLYVNYESLSNSMGIIASYPFSNDMLIFAPTEKDLEDFRIYSGDIDDLKKDIILLEDRLSSESLSEKDFDVYLALPYTDDTELLKKYSEVTSKSRFINGLFILPKDFEGLQAHYFNNRSNDNRLSEDNLDKLCSSSFENFPIYPIATLKLTPDIMKHSKDLRLRDVLPENCLTTVYYSCRK